MDGALQIKPTHRLLLLAFVRTMELRAAEWPEKILARPSGGFLPNG